MKSGKKSKAINSILTTYHFLLTTEPPYNAAALF